MNRPILLVLIGLALLALVGGLAWNHMQRLQDTVADLDRNLSTLSQDVAEARARADAAETQAAAAEARAADAESQAENARLQAEESALRAGEAASAREDAESRARASLESREAEAEKARQAEEALQRAEEARAAAEQERLDARLQALEAEEAARRAEAEADQLRLERERERGRLLDSLSRIAETRRTALGVVMNLDERHVEFDFDRADLRAQDRELLSRIAGVLLTFADLSVQVVGHTDDIGTEAYNLELSERRAAAVRDYLLEVGLDPDVLTIRGMGESSPLVSGTSDEDRQRNRRVELAITLVEGTPTTVVEHDS